MWLDLGWGCRGRRKKFRYLLGVLWRSFSMRIRRWFWAVWKLVLRIFSRSINISLRMSPLIRPNKGSTCSPKINLLIGSRKNLCLCSLNLGWKLLLMLLRILALIGKSILIICSKLYFKLGIIKHVFKKIWVMKLILK